MTNMYHYMSCGLSNVWLKNGFDIQQTPYGEAVSIHDLHGLHRAIADNLVKSNPSLSGEEVRFLRKYLDMPQGTLSRLLRVSENSLRGWENNRTEISKPAETLLRIIVNEFIHGESSVVKAIDEINQLNREIDELRNFEETESGWTAAA